MCRSTLDFVLLRVCDREKKNFYQEKKAIGKRNVIIQYNKIKVYLLHVQQ